MRPSIGRILHYTGDAIVAPCIVVGVKRIVPEQGVAEELTVLDVVVFGAHMGDPTPVRLYRGVPFSPDPCVGFASWPVFE